MDLSNNVNSNECSCGRTGTHCPRCGSKDRYAYAKRRAKLNGAHIQVFRCRMCGEDFDTLLMKDCKAPQLKPKTKRTWIPPAEAESESPETITQDEMDERKDLAMDKISKMGRRK